MLETEDQSGVTVLRLRHGKVNALDTELLRAITAAMQGLDPAAAAVITGAGSAFSAGVDLKRVVDGGQAFLQLGARGVHVLSLRQHDRQARLSVPGQPPIGPG